MLKQASLRNSVALMRGNMLVLTATGVLGMFARGMVFPYASLYVLSLGGQPAQIGWLDSLVPLAGLLVFPIAGYLADHTGRVKLIGLSGLLSASIFFIFVFAPRWQWLVAGSLLRGFMVIQFPPTSALMADSLVPQDRGRGVATMSALSGAPAILAPFVAGGFLDRVGVDPGMRWLYGALMVAYIISGLVSLRYLKETSAETERRLDLADIGRTLREAYGGIPGLWRQFAPSLRAMALVLTLVFVSSAIAGPFWVVYAVDHIGLTKAQWGSILMLETGLRNLVLIPAGAIVDRHGRTRWVLASLTLSLVSLPLFVYARGFAAVLGLRLAAAVSSAFFLPACVALLADLVPRTIRGRVMAAMGNGSVPLGFASGSPGGPGLGFLVVFPLMVTSLSAGYLYTRNPTSPWFVASGAVLISLILVVAFVRDPRQAEV